MDRIISIRITDFERVWGNLMQQSKAEKLEQVLEDSARKIYELFEKTEIVYRKIVDFVLTIFYFIEDKIWYKIDKQKKIIDNPLYKKFRYLTFPWHFLWIIVYLLSKRKKNDRLIYDLPGVHIIVGPPGCGKSSLQFMLAERFRLKTGKPSLINSDFEKARLSEDKTYYFKYHYLYNFTDFWRDRRMVQLPNHKIAASLIIDEGHRILNYRENGSTEYNDKFMPFMNYAVLVRKYIKHIYFSTQMGKVDIQLMHLAQSLTQPRVDIGFDYPDWLVETGAYRFKIKGFFIDQFSIDANGEKSAKPVKSFYIKNEWADFDSFETMAMNDVYDHVKMYQPNNLIRERTHKTNG